MSTVEQLQQRATVESTYLGASRATPETIYALRCRTCPGAPVFRDANPKAKCPTCGGETGPAAKTRPVPVGVATPTPPGLDDDPVIARLQERQRALPTEIYRLEATLKDLRARRKTAADTVAEMRVKVGAGLARQPELDRAEDAVEATDVEIATAENALDDAGSTNRALAESIVARAEQRRAAEAPRATAAARKFAADVTPHLDAIARLAADAEAQGVRFDSIFGETNVHGHRFYRNGVGVGIGILKFFSLDRRRAKSLPELIADFRELAARL